MGNFQLPRLYGLDASGDTLPGALLYFYDAGTTNPITIYQDEANTIPHTNPLVADGDGRFAPVWIADADNPFKSELRDADNVLIWTEDNLRSYDSAGGATLTSNVIVPDGAGDGVTDDSTAVQDALDAAAARNGGGTVDLTGLIWRVDSALTIASGVALVNGTLDLSQASTPPAVGIAGNATKEGSVLLTAASEVGDTSFDINVGDAANFAAGDLVALESTADIFTSVESGELLRVASVGGTTINCETQLIGSYPISSTCVRIDEANILENNVFRDLRIKLKAGAVSHTAIRMDGCRNLTFENVHVYEGPTDGINVRYSEGVRFIGCRIQDVVGNGIDVSHSCRAVSITGCDTQDVGNGIVVGNAVGGVCHSVAISDCTAATGSVGIRANAASATVSMTGCTAEAQSVYAFYMASYGGTIQGCKAARSGHGIYVEHQRTVTFTTDGSYSPASTVDEGGYTITGNVIRLCATRGLSYTCAGASVAHSGVSIAGNTVQGVDGLGVRISGNNVQTHVYMTDNVVNTSTGVSVLDTDNITITGNQISNSTGVGLNIENCDNLRADGNTIETATDGIELDTCSYATCNNNIIRGATNDGIYLNDIGLTSCNGNVVDSPGARGIEWLADAAGTYTQVDISNNQIITPTSQGIVVDCQAGDLINVQLNGNKVDNPTTTVDCVFVDVPAGRTLQHLNVVGGVFRTAGGGAKGVRVQGTATSTLDDVVIANTISEDGGIFVSRCSAVAIDHNRVSDTSEGIWASNCTSSAVTGNRVTGSQQGVRVTGTSNDVSVTGNNLFVSFSGVWFDLAGGDTQVRLTCSGNNVDTTSTVNTAILFEGEDSDSVEYATCVGNTVRGGDSGIRFNHGNYVICNNNVVTNSNDESIYFDDCSNITCNGNVVETAGSGDGIYWRATNEDCTGGVISSNHLTACRITVRADSARDVEQFSITGNNIQDYSDRGILLFANGATQNIIQFFAITGNHIRGTSSNFEGIKLHASGSGSIVRTGSVTGNTMTSTNTTGKGVYILSVASSTTDDLSILSNFIKLASGGSGIGIELDANGTNADIACVGNVISQAPTPIQATNGAFDFSSVDSSPETSANHNVAT